MAVVVYSVSPYRALFDVDNEISMFTFNGVDQYATMPPWFAGGKPRQYWFNFNADAVSTGTEQVIISGIEGGIATEFYLHATLPTLSIRYRSDTGTQAIEVVTGIDIVAGNDYVIHVINLGTGSEVYVNNILVDIEAFEASDGIQPPLTHLGAGHELARFFGGQLWSDRLVDDSPITNTTANFGNGTRYGVLEKSIVLEGDFEISFDCIRQDTASGVGYWAIMFGGGVQRILLQDSGGNDNIKVQVATLPADFDVSQIAQGQHFNFKAVRTGESLEGFVDNISMGTRAIEVDQFSIINIASTGGLNNMPADAAFQNIVIKDLENNLTWNYRLDEGSGTDIINYDASTQDNPYDQPLWDTTANFGNGTRYGQLEKPIVLDAQGSWEIEFECIRQPNTVTIVWAILGVDGGASRVAIGNKPTDQLAGSDEFTISMVGTQDTFTGSLANVAHGQHFHLKYVNNGSAKEVFIDGVSKGTRTNIVPGTLTIDRIAARDGGFGWVMPADAALQNIVIKDLDNNLTWDYRLDEGTGKDIINYDPSTPGHNGSWTPDADWQPTGSYTNNGAWTPDVDWQAQPNNTRYYPMTEGSGPYFLDALWNPTSAPLYRTDALMGNGTRYIEIPQFTIPAGDDMELTWSGIRPTVGGQTRNGLLGSTSLTGSLMIYGPEFTGVSNELRFRHQNIDRSYPNALDGVGLGEHYTGKLVVSGGVIECFINEGYIGAIPVSGSGPTEFSRLCTTNASAGFNMAVGAALQNVILSNLTTGEAIGYKVNEGSGLDVLAYDIVNGEFGAPVPAKNGTITPDADWEYQPGPTDATIQNFDESGWG